MNDLSQAVLQTYDQVLRELTYRQVHM